MPILTVEIVGEVAAQERPGLAARIANKAGVLFNSKPQGTWVKLHFLPENQYAENAGGPAPDVLPVFVSLMMAHVPTGTELTSLLDALSTTIAKCTDRPQENIHTFIEPPGAGRVAFGGKLKT